MSRSGSGTSRFTNSISRTPWHSNGRAQRSPQAIRAVWGDEGSKRQGYWTAIWSQSSFRPWAPRVTRSSACVARAESKGTIMTNARPKLRPLTDAEELAIQAAIASDPDNPELTDEELASM